MTGKGFDEVLDQDWRDLLPDAGFEVVTFTDQGGGHRDRTGASAALQEETGTTCLTARL